MPPYFNNPYDQQVYDAGFKFVPQSKFLQTPFVIPQSDVGTDASTAGLPSINMGGGGGGNPFTGGVTDLITDFSKITSDRQNRLNNPPDTFFGFNTMRDQQLTGPDAGFYDKIPQERTFAGNIQDFLTPQSADSIIAEGYTPRVSLGILQNLLPDRYGELPRGDQAFIARNMGYTGPTVFGENTSGLNKDIFGMNTRSGFGNYGEAVGEEYANLGDSLSGRLADKYGVEFDPVTGSFVGKNALRANQMTKMMRAKYNFYKEQTALRDADRAAAAAAQKQEFIDSGRQKEVADLQARIDAGEFDSTSNKPDRDLGSVTAESAAKTSGVGGGGYTKSDSAREDRRGGQYGFMDGGLADLVDIYD